MGKMSEMFDDHQYEDIGGCSVFGSTWHPRNCWSKVYTASKKGTLFFSLAGWLAARSGSYVKKGSYTLQQAVGRICVCVCVCVHTRSRSYP